MNFKKMGLIGIAVMVIVVIFLINQKQPPQAKVEIVAENAPMYGPISSKDVVGYKMSKWVNENSYFAQEDVHLSQQQVDQLVEWFNSAAHAEKVDQVDPQISAGIAFELKTDREIRIQYAKNEVYVTRNDLSEDGKLNYFKVENPDITGFFETIVEEKS